ncbi:vWA domain-containing protein [Deinococcus humi]|uniref:VWFA domain-containing protein n=1 Tax=Deinococcus humi TaxID=662880 RepID=A0A7W8NFU2_9DEIO|nr:vWA domain-containing protein [Deinococcus humi]MBB5364095.1 hypothetical protein [Deinococcus humi]GGO32386.1 hypothetical protein GCM10008949_29750 [Deinococcus humi]
MQSAILRTLTLSLSLAVLDTAAGATPPKPSPAQAPATCVLPAGPLPTRTRAVFVLDTSGSMRGIGDGQANIFDGVRTELNRYVRTTRPDRVELLTFDAGLRTRKGFDRPAGTVQWNSALQALSADGNNTYLYRSLRAALEPLTGSAQYVTTVFVLTDGIDNDDVRPFTAAQALAAFGTRGPFDRLHYVALGTRIPADARQALIDSDYADGLTVPLGQVPQLDGPGLGTGLLRVNSEGALLVPLADGTRVALATPDARTLQLAENVVTNGQVQLRQSGDVPYGSAAALCAPATAAAPGSVAPRPQRLLLRLKLQSPVTLLNPGADRALAWGEQTVLRYRAIPGLKLDDLKVDGLPPGLGAVVSHLPGAREFSIHFTNRSLDPGQTVTPLLALSGGAEEVMLPAVQGRAGGRTPYAAVPVRLLPAETEAAKAQPTRAAPAGRGATSGGVSAWPWALGLALAAGAVILAWLVVRRKRTGKVPGAGRQRPRRGAAGGARLRPPPPHDEPPAVEGIEYGVGRVLSLVAAGGEVTPVPIPLGGPFDLGQLARVPHLSGLRAEQHRDGLKILRVPVDLEVSQGARLVEAGDVVRPGALLGVAVARAGRAPHLPLGALAGLGLPLTLRHDAANVRAAGPYGQHTVTLPAGQSDLGAAFGAPVLGGLKVTLSGPNVLLVEVPIGLRLRRSGETAPLQPGSYLPDLTLVDLPEGA